MNQERVIRRERTNAKGLDRGRLRRVVRGFIIGRSLLAGQVASFGFGCLSLCLAGLLSSLLEQPFGAALGGGLHVREGPRPDGPERDE